MKKIYLVVANGYLMEFTNGKTKVVDDRIIYYACERKEDAEKDIKRWKQDEMVENEKAILEDKMRTYHNYEVIEINLYQF